MSTENQNSVDLDGDLDVFAAEFFGQNEAPEGQASPEKQDSDDTPEVDAPNDVTHEEPEDTPGEEQEEDQVDDDGEDEEPQPEKPRKKQTAQERINEVVGKHRETERKLQEALNAIEALKQNKEPENKAVTPENLAPTPNDQNEDGTDKYPLGEFDPQYIRDLTKHALAEERAEMKAREAEEASKREADEYAAVLQSNWQEKLGPAQERYPDFQEKGEELISTFEGIDQSYGEYLSATLMSMEYGPDVLYYLANNLDEANKIVKSGPTRATIALGRLEAKFADAAEEKQKARPKVSQAPTPPAHQNKGSAAARPTIPEDTEDLDDFETLFFKKTRR